MRFELILVFKQVDGVNKIINRIWFDLDKKRYYSDYLEDWLSVCDIDTIRLKTLERALERNMSFYITRKDRCDYA